MASEETLKGELKDESVGLLEFRVRGAAKSLHVTGCLQLELRILWNSALGTLIPAELKLQDSVT